MSRTIHVTGGYADYAVGELVERTGKDLSTATIKAALIPTGAAVPAADSTTWKTPDEVEFPTVGTARVSLLVTDATPVGTYWLYVLPADSPTSVPVKGSNTVVKVI